MLAFLTACLFLFQSATLASPLPGESANPKNLNCTNAPSVVAGDYVGPRYARHPTKATATCDPQYQYLYCVPGTRTYIFFGTMAASLQPSTAYAAALKASIAYVANIARLGDGPITLGTQYLTTTGIDVLIHGESGGGNHLTWGVFGSALQGLDAWMAGAENRYSDATFQIHNGDKTVGNGFIGGDNHKGQCVFANAYRENLACMAVDIAGEIYGPGNLC